jgi:diketogulonate reductase-like aldo/keto reductase
VREFLKESGTSRDEVFVQAKIPGHLHGYDKAIQACEDSRELLGLDRIDMLLLHSPNFMTGKHREAWRALVELQRSGGVRCIGVSNFTVQSLGEIIHDTGVTPAVHQVELHPWLAQENLRAEHEPLGIVTQSWNPLGCEDCVFSESAVAYAAADHRVTPAQVVLRWQIQQGVVPLPTSADVAQQRQYLDVFGFELTAAEVAAISALTRPDGRVFGAYPATHGGI